jgi:hypothetical protein
MTRRFATAALVAAATGLSLTGPVAVTSPAAGATTPRWVQHVQRHPGGISNGVRAHATPEAARAQAAYRARPAAGAAAPQGGPNVQMNDDTNPPVPQNETAVAVSLHNPMVAVAGANDYVSGGVAVMRTLNGGRTWSTVRVQPQFGPTRDFCTGGDPALAYSRRDRAFYLAQLCFFRALPYSEIHVFKSVDNGATWTPGRQAAVAATNTDPDTGEVDESVFHDKELITVDNFPTSPFYGRLYVTWTKFHIQPDGFSDYCPIQVAHTDVVPTFNPALTRFTRRPVVPDNPGDDGVGRSANQFSTPVVSRDGALNIAYVSEDCNTSIDRELLFQKSTDGAETFLPRPVKVDKPGQWRDNPDPADLLPPTAFRAPNTVSLDYNRATGTLTFAYTNYRFQARSGGNIAYSQSRDGGLRWSDNRLLSAGPSGGGARNDQFFPWLASAPSGKLYAIWFDRRHDPANRRIHTWQAVSTNDGRSFTTRRISTRDWNPERGFFTSGAFIGDYNGIAASDRAVYPVWTDGRNNAIERTGIGETDVFTDVQISP